MSSLANDFIARSTGSSQVGFDCIKQVRIAPSIVEWHAFKHDTFAFFFVLPKVFKVSLLYESLFVEL